MLPEVLTVPLVLILPPIMLPAADNCPVVCKLPVTMLPVTLSELSTLATVPTIPVSKEPLPTKKLPEVMLPAALILPEIFRFAPEMLPEADTVLPLILPVTLTVLAVYSSVKFSLVLIKASRIESPWPSLATLPTSMICCVIKLVLVLYLPNILV